LCFFFYDHAGFLQVTAVVRMQSAAGFPLIYNHCTPASVGIRYEKTGNR
jgi:hypothetical protein